MNRWKSELAMSILPVVLVSGCAQNPGKHDGGYESEAGMQFDGSIAGEVSEAGPSMEASPKVGARGGTRCDIRRGRARRVRGCGD